MENASELDNEIASSRKTLLAVAAALPDRASLSRELEDARTAQSRGYYLPDEDDRLREAFVHYLDIRTSLLDIVARMEPWVWQGDGLEQRQRHAVFVIGFAAACLLVRSGLFLINLAESGRVVRRKLDEAEPRYRIPRKSFTRLYRTQTSVRRMWKFHEAWKFYQNHREEIRTLEKDPALGPVVALLAREEPFMETRRRNYWKHRIRYRLYSFRRRHRSGYHQAMFHLFEIGGRTISELRDPTVALRKMPKRASGPITVAARELLEPGDIIVSRHRDALTNRFLPGFWPHASLHIGPGHGDGEVVESRKDGVKLRPLEDTLSVDAFLVLRAPVDAALKGEVVNRALTHVGKLYDFAFDFRQADRLACTAVIYRCWHGIGSIDFTLREETGRLCLPAESLIDQALESNGFELAIYFGPDCDGLLTGSDALEEFRRDRQS